MLDQIVDFLVSNGNWVDIGFILLIIYYILITKGFLQNIFETLSTILSFIISYKYYYFAGTFLVNYLSLPRGVSNAAGFFIIWVFLEAFFHIIIAIFTNHFLANFKINRFNKLFSFIPAILQACLIFLFLISFIFAFPVRGNIKRDVLLSRSGPIFINLSQSLESKIKNIFGGAVNETINFLTIKPNSSQIVSLGFEIDNSQLKYDDQSEKQMLELINRERNQRDLSSLLFDDQLANVARDYGKEMFFYGFFAHMSQVDGSSPSERADRSGIRYSVIGENLAYAPDVYVAHQGLINSEGHRANILSPDYNRVGIGVIDGGIYGRMFVQEFTN